MSGKSKLSSELSRLLAVARQHRHDHICRYDDGAHGGAREGGGDAVFEPGCAIRQLPDRLAADAAGIAAAVNPVNMPQSFMAMSGMPDSPLFLTVTVGKYWGPAPRTLTVSFLEATPIALRDRIISHLNAWSNCCGIRFRYTSGTGQVRISRAASGYWSYLGTDILLIPANRPTMNLQGFSMATPESEYKRVVRHEAGHTLGFPHEHMRKELVDRIDRQKAYAYFAQTQGWSQAQVDAQVLTPLNNASIFGTAPDQTSIMCYRLPGSITKNGQPIIGGVDINATDCSFSRQIYPRPLFPGFGLGGAGAGAGEESVANGFEPFESDWSPDEDVDVESVVSDVTGDREHAPAD